jgi:ATP-dependent Clp protease protease subunit
MLINKHIGMDDDDGMGIDGALFQSELLQLDSMGKKRIQVWINSPGGVVTDGYNIYSTILKTKTPVDTYCIGCAASIAGVIFQAGRKRVMMDFSWLMYHNPFGGSDTILSTMKDSIIKMVEQRSGMTEIEVARMMSRETFILANEALEMKLCDQVDHSVEENTKYLRKIASPVDFHKQCNLVLNSLLNTNPKINTPMIKVCMKLGLNDGTPEDSIVQAIDKLINRAEVAEKATAKANIEAENKAKSDADELDKLKALFEKKKAETEKAKADYEDCKSKLDAMEEDKLKAENAATEEKAKNMVEGFAKVGRIKNEAAIKLAWNKLATADFEGTKAMIEALPLNKVASTIER